MIQVDNEVVLTRKVSFNESKDTEENIATISNIIQDGGATPD